MNKHSSKLPGYTLLEMLIVLAIFVILFAITISAFTGLRSTVIMNQSAENFKQNVRWTQRAAIFLKRDPTENWIYGIGLDLRGLKDTTDPNYPSYKVFKWCSPERSYYDDERAQAQFPDFIDGESLNNRGIINFGGADADNLCDSLTEEIEFLGSSELGEITKGSGLINDFEIPRPLVVGTYQTGTEGFPAFVLFESINGNVFYYDETGHLKNFDPSPPNYTPTTDLVMSFVIATPDKEKGLLIEQSPVSGKIITKAIYGSDVEANHYFPPPP